MQGDQSSELGYRSLHSGWCSARTLRGGFEKELPTVSFLKVDDYGRFEVQSMADMVRLPMPQMGHGQGGAGSKNMTGVGPVVDTADGLPERKLMNKYYHRLV